MYSMSPLLWMHYFAILFIPWGSVISSMSPKVVPWWTLPKISSLQGARTMSPLVSLSWKRPQMRWCQWSTLWHQNVAGDWKHLWCTLHHAAQWSKVSSGCSHILEQLAASFPCKAFPRSKQQQLRVIIKLCPGNDGSWSCGYRCWPNPLCFPSAENWKRSWQCVALYNSRHDPMLEGPNHESLAETSPRPLLGHCFWWFRALPLYVPQNGASQRHPLSWVSPCWRKHVLHLGSTVFWHHWSQLSGNGHGRERLHDQVLRSIGPKKHPVHYGRSDAGRQDLETDQHERQCQVDLLWAQVAWTLEARFPAFSCPSCLEFQSVKETSSWKQTN